MAEGLRVRGGDAALRRLALRAAVGWIAMLWFTAGALRQAATAVPKLDMGRFVGVWYEVARISAKKDKCASDALAIYTAGDKKRRWALVNSCKAKDGASGRRTGW